MHPTQVLLEQRHYDFLVEEARRLATSLDALVGELVEARMEEASAAGSALDRIAGIGASEGDAFEELAGMVEGPGDAGGKDHDVILYGRPRR